MATVVEEPRSDVVETPPQAPAAPPPEAPERVPSIAPPLPVERPLTREEILRPAIGALMTTLGCAFLVGGMFTGYSARIYAAVGGIVGVAMAVWAAGARKRVSVIQALSLFGILLVGILALAFGGGGLKAVTGLGDVVGDAAGNARLHRPPSPFDLGWRAILPWTVGMIGYASAWIGSVGRKPAAGILLPIPIIAFAAIAQPAEAQIPAGIVAFVTFALGLAIIYRADRGEGEGVSTAYELKRAMRATPLIAVLIAALVALSQTGFLFPKPLYDPTQRAIKPKPIPLSEVRDRVLFDVNIRREEHRFFTGPWRTGVLDVYDGSAWRLAPFAASTLKDAPSDGVLDSLLQPQIEAEITVAGLDGTVIPLPGRMHGIRGQVPKLVVDARSQTVRVKEGQVTPELKYTAFFALLPTEEQLKQAGPPNVELQEFLDTGGQPPPPAVQALLDEAPVQLWERLDFVRETLLDTVTSTGSGLPVDVPPSKVQDMLAGSKEASPYEIVAGQTLMARWAGVPARIGYGFDKGEDIGDRREFRPKHGAAWLEVYFQGHGWFPVTGLPKQAKRSITGQETVEADILPSDEIQVQLFIPLRVAPKNLFLKQVQVLLALASPVIITMLLMWLTWPIAYKARRRARRRQWALNYGRAARIAVAYADLRDLATDLGVGDPYVTPLAYVTKVVPDDEHAELAWLVTRCLWGDLRHSITDDEVFAAEELSRSLRRRMFEAQPFTIRAIALVSRLSLRNPYAPELLSPALRKVSVRAAVKSIVLAFSPKRILRAVLRVARIKRKPKETPDEAVETA